VPRYEYGKADHQVHPFVREKKLWSETKDTILAKYIDSYLRTVHARGRPIAVVDCFAGPGLFGDGSEGSPLIICKAIRKLANRGSISVPAKAYFADTRTGHRDALRSNLARFGDIAQQPDSSCADVIARVLRECHGYTLFFYLDPWGLKGLEFNTIRPTLERDPRQSTEVLINFSYPSFMRLAGNWDYDDSLETVGEKVKEAKVDLVNAVMNGDYWLKVILTTADKVDREHAVVDAYKDTALGPYFDYVVSCPVEVIDDVPRVTGLPEEQIAKYHLIFATRHRRGVAYMHDFMYGALEPYLRRFEKGTLFAVTPERYEEPRDLEQEVIPLVAQAGEISRGDLLDELIVTFTARQRRFPRFKRKELRPVVDRLIRAGKLFTKNPPGQEGRLNDRTLLSVKPFS